MKKIIDDFTRPKILEIASDFRKRRQNLNISQLKLSKICNLSSSIINKFESGKIDPTYSTVLKIDAGLSSLEKLSGLCASDIMITDIAMVDSSTVISKAADIMRENDFSQLLVMDLGKLKGVIYETDLLDAVFKNQLNPHIETVDKILSGVPLIVSPDYLVSDLSYIFQNKKTKFVLVADNFRFLGLVTPSDIFKN